MDEDVCLPFKLGYQCFLIMRFLMEGADYSRDSGMQDYTLTYPNAAKLIGWCLTMQMDHQPKHTAYATQDLLEANKLNILQ